MTTESLEQAKNAARDAYDVAMQIQAKELDLGSLTLRQRNAIHAVMWASVDAAIAELGVSVPAETGRIEPVGWFKHTGPLESRVCADGIWEECFEGTDEAIPLYRSPSLPTMPEGWQQLMRFYSVDTVEKLVDSMERHIERLQAKLPRSPDTQPRRVREG